METQDLRYHNGQKQDKDEEYCVLCDKEDRGTNEMCYGVVCKNVMSCMSAACSLPGVRDTVPTVSCLLLIDKARAKDKTYNVGAMKD